MDTKKDTKKVKKIEPIKKVKSIAEAVAEAEKYADKTVVIAEGLFNKIRIIKALNEPTIIEIKIFDESIAPEEKLIKELNKIKNIRVKIEAV